MKGFSYKKVSDSPDFVEYSVTIDWDLFEREKDRVFETLAKEVTLPGFRPGKGPRNVIEEKLGVKLLTETLNNLVPKVTYEIIVSEKKNPITTPEYDIKEIDKTKGVIYTFKFTNYPEIELGDFTKIKVDKKKVDVTDEDVESVIKNIAQTTLTPEKLKKFQKPKKTSNKIKSSEKKSKKSKKSDDTEKEYDLELSDELVSELGYEEHKTLESLKKAVRQKLEELQQEQIENDYIGQIVEKAIELSKFNIPKVLLEKESENMERDFTERLKQLNLDAEDYLKSQGTNLEERRKLWQKEAERKIASDLVLIKIASEHKLLPSDEDVDSEIEKIEDEQVRKNYQNEEAKNYIRSVLTKQRGIKKLKEIVEQNTKKPNQSKSSKKQGS
ncbi:MAG: trigger factor [Candidatus Dojkabacteria bacterium]|nr:MAG: trigger factor [Candidatus Dojkabacteria bacterium]